MQTKNSAVRRLAAISVLVVLGSGAAIAGFEQRAQEVLQYYGTHESIFSPTDDATGYAKSGVYHAMAAYAIGDTNRGNQITTHIFSSPGGASMFLVMAGMDLYLRYNQYMPGTLKDRIRSFVTSFDGYPFGTTENHKVMSATGAFLACETWPDWSRASSVKSACHAHMVEFIDRLCRWGLAEYDSPTYEVFFVNSLLSLYDHTQDSDLRQRALMGLEVLLADMAGEWVDGVWGASTLRTHKFVGEAADGKISRMVGYIYFGGPAFPAPNDGCAVMCAVTSYRLPQVIEAMGTDRTTPHVHKETAMAWTGARKTTCINHGYAVYSQYDGNQSLFWSDQMHRAGVAWSTVDLGAQFVVKHPKAGLAGESQYNQVLQHEGVLVGVAKESMTGYVPRNGGAREVRESGGWVFVDGGSAYVAFTCHGGYAWGGDVVARGINPTYLVADTSNWTSTYRSFSLNGGSKNGWVVQTAHPSVYAGFDAFVQAVQNNTAPDFSGVGNSDPMVRYTTLDGDALQITYDGRGGGGGTDRRLVNGTPLDYANWPRLDNPWMHSDLDGSTLVMTRGTLVRTYNFSNWTVVEQGGEPDYTPPSVPANLAATETGSSYIALSWTASADEGSGVMGYEVFLDGSADPVAEPIQPNARISDLTMNTSYTFTVKAVDRSGNASTRSDPLTVSTTDYDGLRIPMVAASPALDGTVDADWLKAPECSMMSSPVAGTLGSAADLSATFRLLWDETALYVLVEVSDDIRQDDSPELWQDDGVEVMIDIGNDKAGSIGADDFQYLIDAGAASFEERKHGASSGVAMAASSVTGGYVLEVSLPWATLGLAQPGAGIEIGFCLAVDDDDDGGDRDGQIAWKGTSDNYRTPSLWGTAMLSAQAVLLHSSAQRTVDAWRVSRVGRQLTMLLPARSSSGATLSVYDTRGRVVASGKANAGALRVSVPLAGVSTGWYLYEATNGKSVVAHGRVR